MCVCWSNVICCYTYEKEMFEVSRHQTWWAHGRTYLALLSSLPGSFSLEMAETWFIFLSLSQYEGYWISPKISASVLWLWVAFGLAVCPELHTLPPKFG